jgi:hypothetical protein
LRIGIIERGNIRVVKRNERPERLRLEELERERVRLEWENTPKYRRGYIFSRLGLGLGLGLCLCLSEP